MVKTLRSRVVGATEDLKTFLEVVKAVVKSDSPVGMEIRHMPEH